MVTHIATARANDGQTAGTSSITCTVPTIGPGGSVAIGDTLVFCMACSSGTANLGAPSGWRALRPDEDTINNNLMAQVWAKDINASSEIGSIVSFGRVDGSGSRLIGAMHVVRGTSASLLTAGAPTTTTPEATSHASPAVTVAANSTALLNFWVIRSGTPAPPPDVDVTTSTQTDDVTTKTAFSASPNLGVHLSHRTTAASAGSIPASAATTLTEGTATAEAATAIIYTVLAPPQSTIGSGPLAAFNATPQTGAAPLAVTFTNASTGSPTSYLWDFGDGSATSTATSPTHTYATPGTYTVTLTATNTTSSSQAQLAVQAYSPVTTGGCALYICKGGAWVPFSLKINAPGEESPPAVGLWDDNAPWVDADPWGATT